jgi:hypothetical protein
MPPPLQRDAIALRSLAARAHLVDGVGRRIRGGLGVKKTKNRK